MTKRRLNKSGDWSIGNRPCLSLLTGKRSFPDKSEYEFRHWRKPQLYEKQDFRVSLKNSKKPGHKSFSFSFLIRSRVILPIFVTRPLIRTMGMGGYSFSMIMRM